MVFEPWMLGGLLIILDGFFFGLFKKKIQPFNSSTN
jgi:hypothetical protein